jgi:ribosomal-protein-serine acetyltransferase
MLNCHSRMSTICIRPYELEDVDALFEAALESTVDVHPWLPWCHPDYARDEAEAWIALQVEAWRQRTEFQFVITSPAGLFLGGCGLNAINSEHKFANLGYWVRSSAAGAGVATAATELTRDWAFENTELERLEILVATPNAASVRVPEKAGAVREGVLRARLRVHDRAYDAFVYSFVRGRDAQ